MDFVGAYSWVNVKFLFDGLLVTLEVALIAIFFSFLIGCIIGVLRYTNIPVLSHILAFLVETVRNLPLILIIFFTYFALPEVGVKLTVFSSAIAALTIFESAMIAEIVRGGLNSVEKGQMEAARSIGLTHRQALWYVVLPQALRRMAPPIVSQFISLNKDTALAIIISLPELMHNVQIVYGKNVNYVMPMYLLAGLMYFLVNYSLSILSRRLEWKQA